MKIDAVSGPVFKLNSNLHFKIEIHTLPCSRVVVEMVLMMMVM